MTQLWEKQNALIEEVGFQSNVGVHVTKALPVSKSTAFALGNGCVLFADENGEIEQHQAHNGACLAAATVNETVVTSGDDGRIVATQMGGMPTVLYEQVGRIFDQLASAPWGGIAFADARRLSVLLPDNSVKHHRTSGSVGGLCFAPIGHSLAVSRNNGVSVYAPEAEDLEPDDYVWQGAHGPVTWAPSGDFIVTAMFENALHVWRVDRQNHGRIGGYPARIKSMSWSPDGKQLATSGADSVIIWPFVADSGPIGQSAEQIAIAPGVIVSELAWHPTADVIAIGTDGGDVVLTRPDGALVPVSLGLGSTVTTLVWDIPGKRLSFGSEKGALGIADLSNYL